MRRRNLIAAAVLIAVSVGYGILTSQLPTRSLPYTPGPPFFPWIATALLLALSLGLLAQGLFGAVDGAVVAADAAARRRAGAALAVLLGYLVVLPGLGFVLATIPFFALQMLLFGERRPLPVAAGAVGVTLGLYILFRHGFGVFLPRGMLPGLLGGIVA
jgi:hypothetical protein